MKQGGPWGPCGDRVGRHMDECSQTSTNQVPGTQRRQGPTPNCGSGSRLSDPRGWAELQRRSFKEREWCGGKGKDKAGAKSG